MVMPLMWGRASQEFNNSVSCLFSKGGTVVTKEFPVRLTKRSAAAIKQMMSNIREAPGTVFVRILILRNGNTGIRLVKEVNLGADILGESLGLRLAVARSECKALTGYVLDYRSIGPDKGFIVKDPRSLHSRASDPGRLILSSEKLQRLQPELFTNTRGFLGWLLGRGCDSGHEEIREGLIEHLRNGDSRAAVVVSVLPLVVAAYTDELDCVALLRFPEHLVDEHHLGVSSRLLTVNTYRRPKGNSRPGDLVPGPKDTGRYVNFIPLIAEFLAYDMDQVERKKSVIAEDEWQRTIVMGNQQWARGVTPRDGRPMYSGQTSS